MADIVLLSTADWDHPLWTNKQHVACSLAAEGERVLYVESLGIRSVQAKTQDYRRILRRVLLGLRFVRQVRPRVWVLSPLVLPGGSRGLALRLNRLMLRCSVSLACWVLRFRSPWLWTYNPLTLLYLQLKGFSLAIYHAVDAVQEQPCMPKALIESEEARLCRSVDQVFTTSPFLAERLSKHTDRICYEANVADRDHFSVALEQRQDPAFVDPPELQGIPEPKIGFVGAISSYKLDFALIRSVALRHPEWHFVFIGPQSEGEPSTDLSQLCGLSNVHWLGPKPYSQLPRFLAGFQCAWLPLQCNAYTRAMFPMKFFEYLFAGLPVVSTRIHALRSFEAICSLCPPDPSEFSHQIQQVLAGEGPTLEQRLRGIEGYTYASRTRRMLKLLRAQFGCV